ncbi:UNVERIFIED_CONTAM: hypothetical protein Slati_0795800 [Sesamum latifolium]|uniref:Uncharacterized protein n=1 Tax=Sesamum latifolium TaxID=2727402 RepID=A0AAW2XLF2_9LAMI
MLEMLKEKGVVPEENKVREVLKSKRGPVYRAVMSFVWEVSIGVFSMMAAFEVKSNSYPGSANQT